MVAGTQYACIVLRFSGLSQVEGAVCGKERKKKGGEVGKTLVLTKYASACFSSY